MAKLTGFVLLLFVLPLGLLAVVVLAASLKFHAAAAPCIVHEVQPAVLYEGTYFSIEYPIASHCIRRYNGQ